jgi:hypothetical protein
MKKPTETNKPAVSNRMVSAQQITVRVVCPQPLGEPGGPYNPGETFTTTTDRVAALGSLVEIATEK